MFRRISLVDAGVGVQAGGDLFVELAQVEALFVGEEPVVHGQELAQQIIDRGRGLDHGCCTAVHTPDPTRGSDTSGPDSPSWKRIWKSVDNFFGRGWVHHLDAVYTPVRGWLRLRPLVRPAEICGSIAKLADLGADRATSRKFRWVDPILGVRAGIHLDTVAARPTR
ncbi:hypothetical protein [Enemella evansiae]|uniref:hypothetical protein n=1 Tax=Enemella evansiae TaxID=2016499 RepID=UPI001140238A|nr:hypothetical protein [Enemella evansiae]